MKKILLVVLTSLLSNFYSFKEGFAQCQIQNAGFENWTGPFPDDWYAITCREGPGRLGGSCLETDTSVTFPFIFNPIFGNASPCSTRSAYLNGYIKGNFSSTMSDTLYLAVGFKLANDTNYASFASAYTIQNRAAWTPFHIPFFNLANGPVDTVIVTGFLQGINSLISLDDLSLSNTPIGQLLGPSVITSNTPRKFSQNKAKAQINVAPNPLIEQGTLHFQGVSGYAKVKLVDQSGKLVKQLFEGEIQIDSRMNISTTGIRHGLYLIYLETQRGSFQKRISIQ